MIITVFYCLCLCLFSAYEYTISSSENVFLIKKTKLQLCSVGKAVGLFPYLAPSYFFGCYLCASAPMMCTKELRALFTTGERALVLKE